MDPRMLNYYNRELQHLREMGGEFAEPLPENRRPAGPGRIRVRRSLCRTPAGRARLPGGAGPAQARRPVPRIHAAPLEIVYPHYVAPRRRWPSCTSSPDYREGRSPRARLCPAAPRFSAASARANKLPAATRRRIPSRSGRCRSSRSITTVAMKPCAAPPTCRAFARAAVASGLHRRADLRQDRTRSPPRLSAGCGRTDDGPIRAVAGEPRCHGRLPGRIGGPVAGDHRTGRNPPRPVSRTTSPSCPMARESFQGYRLLHEYFAMPERYLVRGAGRIVARLAPLPGQRGRCFRPFQQDQPRARASH